MKNYQYAAILIEELNLRPEPATTEIKCETIKHGHRRRNHGKYHVKTLVNYK